MKKRIAAGVLALSMMMGTASFAKNHVCDYKYSGTNLDTMEVCYQCDECGRFYCN